MNNNSQVTVKLASKGQAKQNGKQKKSQRKNGNKIRKGKRLVKLSKQDKKRLQGLKQKPEYKKMAKVERSIAKKVVSKCINPGPVILAIDFERSWGRAIDIIDSYAKVAQIQKPQNFVRLVNTSSASAPPQPAIRFTMLRAIWLAAVRQYWYNIGIITGSSSTSTLRVQNVTLPNGLAKFVQQFAPYTDTTTGIQYQFQIQPYGDGVNIFSNYPDLSVAAASGTIATNLSLPRSQYLIHPSDWVSGGRTNDVGTSSSSPNPLYPFDGTTVTWTAFISTITQAETSAINALFNGVNPNDIPNYAPDNSAYTVITNYSISSLCPKFEPLMSVITGIFQAVDNENDREANYPYVKSLPAIKYQKSYAFPTYGLGYRNVLYLLYATISSAVTTFDPNADSLTQLRYTECYGGMKHWSFSGVKVSQFMIAERLSEYMDSLNRNDASNTNTNSTTLFGLSAMFWSAVYYRVSPWDAILDIGSYYRGYCYGTGLPTLQLPATLARVVSGLGPVVHNGRLYLPYFYEDPPQWTNRISAASPYNWNMSNSLYTDFTFSGTCYRPISGTTTTPVNLADATPIIPNSTIRYTVYPVKLFKYLSEAMKRLDGYNPNRGTQMTKVCLGCPNRILGLCQINPITADYGNTNALVNIYERIWVANITASTHMICATTLDSVDTMTYGLLCLLPANFVILKPLTSLSTAVMDGVLSEVAVQVEGQNRYDPGQGMTYALQQQPTVNNFKKNGLEISGKKKLVTQYGQSQIPLLNQMYQQQEKVVANNVPSYDSVGTVLQKMATSYLTTASKLPSHVTNFNPNAKPFVPRTPSVNTQAIVTTGQTATGNVGHHSNQSSFGRLAGGAAHLLGKTVVDSLPLISAIVSASI